MLIQNLFSTWKNLTTILFSLDALTGPGNPGGPMSPFHPCNERTGDYANPKEWVVKKQNTWLNNKLMVKAMSFRYNVQTRLQGCCLEVIFLASPCLGGVF